MHTTPEMTETELRELYMGCDKEVLVTMLIEANALLKKVLSEQPLPAYEVEEHEQWQIDAKTKGEVRVKIEPHYAGDYRIEYDGKYITLFGKDMRHESMQYGNTGEERPTEYEEMVLIGCVAEIRKANPEIKEVTDTEIVIDMGIELNPPLPTPESMNQIFVNGEWVTDTTVLPEHDDLGDYMDRENERQMDRFEARQEHEFEKSKGESGN